MSKSIDRARFTCSVSSYRRQEIPGTPHGKVSTAYISAREIVEKLDLKPWMSVNPRVPKLSRNGLLSGHVIKGIKGTLEGAPQDFSLKNLGLYILADRVDHDRGTDVLTFEMTDPECHGLCNGGHTFAALIDFNERSDLKENLAKAFVRVQIFEGIDGSQVVDMAEGMNRSRQVDDASLDDLRKNFETIKKAMADAPGRDEIGYHMGDVNGDGQPCAYYITEIVRNLMFFNRKEYNDSKHPHNLYRYQKRTMDLFRKSADREMAIVCSNAPMFMRLWHDICKKLADAQVDGRRLRRMEIKERSKDGTVHTAGGVNTILHFNESNVDCAIFNGWVLPMLAAFRANVRDGDEPNSLEWQEPTDEILGEVIGKFYEICARANDDGRKPDDVGRDASIFSQMYDIVAGFLREKKLAKTEAEQAETAKELAAVLKKLKALEASS